MKVAIAADHWGYDKKRKLVKYMSKKGLDVTDLGADSKESSDFVDYSNLLCESVVNNIVDFGILICGTGIGMSIAANKNKGIYCAKIDSVKEAGLAKSHNHANVLAISARKYLFEIKDMIDEYLKAEKQEEERYIRRINKIKDLEKKMK